MTRQEAADYLQISLSTFAKNIQSELPRIKLGKNVRFRKSDIDKYLEGKVEILYSNKR